MMSMWRLLVLATMVATACGKKDLELKGSYVKCRACEVASEILVNGLVEGDKSASHKMATGHRLDPNGKHINREFDFKRSETRITEHLEGVCGQLSSYSFLSVAMPAKKKGGPKRKISYLVEKNSIPDSTVLHHNLKSKVKESCQDIVGDDDGPIIASLQAGKDGESAQESIDRLKADWCYSQLAKCVPLPKRPEPRNGGWTNWTDWTECDKACAGGKRSRNRTCTSPSRYAGGRDCSGQGDESEPCNTDPCPGTDGFSEWSAWSACDVGCGEGKQKRTRYCDAPEEGCTGILEEQQVCVDADGTEECAKRAEAAKEEEVEPAAKEEAGPKEVAPEAVATQGQEKEGEL